MITVELRVTDENGREVFREVLDPQPCNRYEVEVVGLGTFTARVTEWKLIDGQYQPVESVG